MILQLMLTRIIIIYIAVRPAWLPLRSTAAWPLVANIRCFKAPVGRLGVFAQAGGNQQQPQQFEQTVGDEGHQRRRDRSGKNGGHVI